MLVYKVDYLRKLADTYQKKLLFKWKWLAIREKMFYNEFRKDTPPGYKGVNFKNLLILNGGIFNE